MSEHLINIKASIAASQAAAQMDHRRRLHAAKNAAMNAYQQKSITEEEYQEATGEPYVKTVEEGYHIDLEAAKMVVATRVRSGLLTEADYEAITGEAYGREVGA